MSIDVSKMSLADVLKVLPSLSESDQRVLEAQLAKLEELKGYIAAIRRAYEAVTKPAA